MTLTEFLLARIAEDEDQARQAALVSSPRWVAMNSLLMHLGPGEVPQAEVLACVDHYLMNDAWMHVERHDPARVLAECEAKRRILEQETGARIMHASVPWHTESYRGVGRGGMELLSEGGDVIASGADAVALIEAHSDPVVDTPTLRLLALPYADHPDYDEAWRP